MCTTQPSLPSLLKYFYLHDNRRHSHCVCNFAKAAEISKRDCGKSGVSKRNKSNFENLKTCKSFTLL